MTDFITVESEKLGEKYYKLKHKSGLSVYVFPKELSTTYAILATHYGSLEQTFRIVGEKDTITVPDGVAHFLEHKMFEEEDGSDAFEKFAPYGANANAYTSNEMTAYLFSATEHVEESLQILLSFVTHPYFTEENVAKEQGIIGEEIRMCDDRPGTRLYYAMLDGLYVNHSIKTNICGTVETISKITPEILYRCYNTFYHPSNMALCVVGNIDKETVLRLVDEAYPAREPLEIERFYAEEPVEINKKRTDIEMSVSRPQFAIGFKDVPLADSEECDKRAIAAVILSTLAFSETSDFYSDLYRNGLVSVPLRYGYNYGAGYAYYALFGESENPDAVRDRILAEICRLKENPPSEDDFRRTVRGMLSDEIRTFDDVEAIGDAFIEDLFHGDEIFNATLRIQKVSYDDVLNFLHEFFSEDKMTMAVISPKK